MENRYAELDALVTNFELAMMDPVAEAEVSELFAGFGVPPVILAQVIMAALPIPGDKGMPKEQKTFWMEVAAHMGPDWIAEFRNVGDFMDKVDNF